VDDKTRPGNLGAGWSGAVHVVGLEGADKLSVAANHIHDGKLSSATVAEPSDRVLLPLLAKDNFGVTSSFAVQNTSPDEIGIEVTYSYPAAETAPGGEAVPASERIRLKPYAAHVFGQAQAPGAAPKVFSAKLLASRPVVATVFQESAGQLLEYAAFPEAAAGRELAAPLVMANNFGTYTGVQVQNAGTEPTEITVTYGPDTWTSHYGSDAPDGSCGTPRPGSSGSAPDQLVQPGASVTFVQAAGEAAPGFDQQFGGCGYVGSARITSSNDQPLVAVVNQVNPGGVDGQVPFGSSYETKRVDALDGSVDLPLVQSNNFGTTGGVQVQNAGGSDAKVSVLFNANTVTTTPPGASAPCTGLPWSKSFTLSRQTSETFLLPSGVPALRVGGCRYVGSVTITSTTAGAQLAAMANQVIPGMRDGLGTYSSG
jgi:hypothetical protein